MYLFIQWFLLGHCLPQQFHLCCLVFLQSLAKGPSIPQKEHLRVFLLILPLEFPPPLFQFNPRTYMMTLAVCSLKAVNLLIVCSKKGSVWSSSELFLAKLFKIIFVLSSRLEHIINATQFMTFGITIINSSISFLYFFILSMYWSQEMYSRFSHVLHF